MPTIGATGNGAPAQDKGIIWDVGPRGTSEPYQTRIHRGLVWFFSQDWLWTGESTWASRGLVRGIGIWPK